ncbi:MAG: hypothetical protein ACLP1X_24930 [Polyangiaceae bacterium]
MVWPTIGDPYEVVDVVVSPVVVEFIVRTALPNRVTVAATAMEMAPVEPTLVIVSCSASGCKRHAGSLQVVENDSVVDRLPLFVTAFVTVHVPTPASGPGPSPSKSGAHASGTKPSADWLRPTSSGCPLSLPLHACASASKPKGRSERLSERRIHLE